jgi:peptidoglycan L-alanyl-D-glutamate endopeptidase CwlK
MDARSEKSLVGVHPDLVAVMRRAATIAPGRFTIIEGMRDAKRQAALKKAGASWVTVSRHQSGHAVDVVALVGGEVDWKSIATFKAINDAVQKAAKEYGIPIIWGGNWKKRDYGHFELPKAQYPAKAAHVAKAGLPAPKAVPIPVPKPAPELADVLMVGSEGPRVKALQIELKRLNYHSGGIDEKYGNLTRDAVMAFQADNGLKTDGMAGEKTWAALKIATPRPLMAERKSATVEDLADKGSVIADGAVKSKKGAWATITAGVATVGAKVADSAGDLVNLPLEPLKYAFQTWGPWLFGTVIVGAGVFFLWQARKVGDARVADHKDAKTL